MTCITHDDLRSPRERIERAIPALGLFGRSIAPSNSNNEERKKARIKPRK